MKKSKVLFFSLLLLSFTPYKAAEPTDIPEIQELIFKPRRETCFFSASQQTRPCTKEDFLEIAKWIGGANVKYYLQNFRAEKTIDPEFEKVTPFSNEFLKEIVEDIKPYFKECQVR